MRGIYGLWPGVVAIVADADMFCVSCAADLYGQDVIQAVVDGVSGCVALVDGEGNPFGVVLRGSEDLHTVVCAACHERLCEEECGCYRFPNAWLLYGILVMDGELTEYDEDHRGGSACGSVPFMIDPFEPPIPRERSLVLPDGEE